MCLEAQHKATAGPSSENTNHDLVCTDNTEYEAEPDKEQDENYKYFKIFQKAMCPNAKKCKSEDITWNLYHFDITGNQYTKIAKDYRMEEYIDKPQD